jgi:hypothetical protein
MHSIFLPAKSTARRIDNAAIIVLAAAPARIQSAPYEKWPIWAKAVRKFSRPGDVGIGDTIVHLIGDTRSARFKEWFERKFGKSCGCTERQRWLNLRYAYGKD